MAATLMTVQAHAAAIFESDPFEFLSDDKIGSRIQKLKEVEEAFSNMGKVAVGFSETLSNVFQIVSDDAAAFAQFSKALAAFETAIAAGEAIAKTVTLALRGSATPIDFAIQLAATLAVVTRFVAQAKSAISSTQAPQPPQFAKGVVDYSGKGTGTSDSNIVQISRGESIVTAEATKRTENLLKSINAGKEQDYIYKTYIEPILAAQAGLDSATFARGNKSLLKQLQNNKGVEIENANYLGQVIADKVGYSSYVKGKRY